MQYSIISYSHYAIHYITRTDVSYNWKFAHISQTHNQSFKNFTFKMSLTFSHATERH